mmetsp:Transcript_51460/g.135825  ORF Transcript_51460/g.135825 Transcript_51460/m.135825 type:complete len:614 (-) Transcript_51460:12-1853(-)
MCLSCVGPWFDLGQSSCGCRRCCWNCSGSHSRCTTLGLPQAPGWFQGLEPAQTRIAPRGRRKRFGRQVKLETREDRELLSTCIDPQFRVITACTLSGGQVVPFGSELLSDGLLTAGLVPRQLRHYPIGSVFAFRWCAKTPLVSFLETHCGASRDRLLGHAAVSLVMGGSVVVAVAWSSSIGLAVVAACGLLVWISPGVCVLLAPDYAPWVHVAVSILFSVIAAVSGMVLAADDGVMFFVIPSIVVMTHFCLQRRLEYMQSVAAVFTVLFALVISWFFSLSFAATAKGEFGPTHYPGVSNFSFPRVGTRNPGGKSFPSPACTASYSTGASGELKLVDFAFFNKIVYEPEGNLEAMLDLWMSDWHLVKQQRRESGCVDPERCNVVDWATWFVFDGKVGTKHENATVLTVRGTKTKLEAVFDLDLWAVAGLRNVASQFALLGPVVNAFLVSDIVGVWYRHKKARYRSIVRYMQLRKILEPHRTYYISGHSLGGGLANLVSTEISIPAVTLSAPGVQQTAQLLGLDPLKLQYLAMNVIPRTDPVPHGAGSQGCIVVPIDCTANPGDDCHRVFNTVCSLLHECGDSATPARTLPCGFCPKELSQWPSLEAQCKAIPLV